MRAGNRKRGLCVHPVLHETERAHPRRAAVVRALRIALSRRDIDRVRLR